MDLPSKILIKRRKEGAVGPPSSLLNGELGFNEVDQILYYGSGDDGNGNAVNINPIAGGFTNILKDSYYIHNPQNNPQPTDSYLVIKINGVEKAIRLFDL
jgi:hypothetical protein